MAELLITARDIDIYKKGYVITVQEDGHIWGGSEGLPDFIQLTVTGATADQVRSFLEDWPLKFNHSIVSQDEANYRVRVEIDPAYLDVSETSKDVIKQEMRDYIEGAEPESPWSGCSIFSFAPAAMVVDIPKPADLPALKEDFHDKFAAVLDIRRYYFTAADVDTAIAAGGTYTMTKTQALNRIVDKLAV